MQPDENDEVEMIDLARSGTQELYQAKSGHIRSNIDHAKRLTSIFNNQDNPEESKASIAGELFEIQEEEMGRQSRTHSYVENFRNLMEDQQNINVKYSNQDRTVTATQIQCKNKIIESIIERYIKEYEIDRDKW